jgi:uroporphyrinogen-III synthase
LRFSHALITRPRSEAEHLASLLSALGLESIVLPPFRFSAGSLSAQDLQDLEDPSATGPSPLLIFTSTRSVEFALSLLPGTLLARARIAAIGPSTARALRESGCRVDIRPEAGYTSEALIAALESLPPGAGNAAAYILAAPGGRKKLAVSLEKSGWRVGMLWVYVREPAVIDQAALEAIAQASSLLCIWTSGNAMKSLSQRLPPAAWYRICTGEWLVISDRLQRLARAYGPSRIHLAHGPGNQDILAAVKNI